MAVDPYLPRPRRALIAAALGAAAASIAQAIGRPATVSASDPNDVVKNINNVVTATTSLENSANNADVLIGSSLGSGKGVYGYSASGIGVYGQAAGVGTGVYAAGGNYGVLATGAVDAIRGTSVGGYGVRGISTSGEGVSGASTNSYGVRGFSSLSGGVYGEGDSGPGVIARSITGIALDASTNSTDAVAVQAYSAGHVTAVLGVSGPTLPTTQLNVGIHGHGGIEAASRGMLGQANQGTGVHGFVGAGDAPAPTTKTGVYGRCDIGTEARGVFGFSGDGSGVYGRTTNGSAVVGTATGTTGYAFKGSGRMTLAKISGLATLAAGNTSVTVTPGVDIGSGTFIIVTPQSDPGGRRLWVTKDATANTITIRSNVSVGTSLSVAYLILG